MRSKLSTIVSWVRKPDTLICIALAVVTFAAYWQVYDFELTTRDDNDYITNNPAVQIGLNSRTVRWAFTAPYQATWQPLTWISLMADTDAGKLLSAFSDISLGTGNTGVYHLTNVLLHILAAVLLFLVMARATKMRWPSAIVAALFAVHPMHVESVAWAAERKDVLSAVFWMLTTWAYLGYVEKPSPKNYAWVVLFFALGLMSKPMLVTLPFALLLMDVWPLRRRVSWELVQEKWALLMLAVASCGVTMWAQKAGGAVASLDALPLGQRLANAIVSYVEYVILTFWPAGLSNLYPHPGDSIALWKIVGSTALMLVLTVLAVLQVRRRPWVFVGWLWFVGTLLPVIGIVQTGNHAMADRFSYIPHIGLFAMLVYWPFCASKSLSRVASSALAAAWGVAVVALWVVSYQQIGTWRNGETLYRQAIAVTENNPIAHNGLGAVLAANDDFEQAEYHFRKAVRQQPEFVEARGNLASALGKLERFKEAEAEYRRLIRDVPDYTPARNNLGALYAIQGRVSAAVREWRESLKVNPQDQEALYYLNQVGASP